MIILITIQLWISKIRLNQRMNITQLPIVWSFDLRSAYITKRGYRCLKLVQALHAKNQFLQIRFLVFGHPNWANTKRNNCRRIAWFASTSFQQMIKCMRWPEHSPRWCRRRQDRRCRIFLTQIETSTQIRAAWGIWAWRIQIIWTIRGSKNR